MQTEVLPEIDKDVTENDGKAHWVRVRALMQGGAVVALCGKKYVPNDIATAGLKEICPTCQELYKLLESMDS